jgi:hypothetical protein
LEINIYLLLIWTTILFQIFPHSEAIIGEGQIAINLTLKFILEERWDLRLKTMIVTEFLEWMPKVKAMKKLFAQTLKDMAWLL